MNVLFLTLGKIYDLKSSDIYSDLMREFIRHGHKVFIVTPVERQSGKKTTCYESDGATIIAVRTLNFQTSSFIEKGLATVLVGSQYKKAIKKYLGSDRIDIVTYSTPPITLSGVVAYVKRHFGAWSYLQLKDIFPQNAIDIGMMKDKGIICRYFRKREKVLYAVSDYIGCMSPANVEYLLQHYPYIDKQKVEICPNAIEMWPHEKEDCEFIRGKYGLPREKPIFLYGGNLGKPQGIRFLVKCLESVANRPDCHFLIIGSGTEAHLVDEFIESYRPSNISKISFLPKNEYYKVVSACDVGLIFLDCRFTIPNFPSRLLPYLDFKLPVICLTDVNTDIKDVVIENGLGLWCESRNPADFVGCIDQMLNSNIHEIGERCYLFLKENYHVSKAYDAIMKHFE